MLLQLINRMQGRRVRLRLTIIIIIITIITLLLLIQIPDIIFRILQRTVRIILADMHNINFTLLTTTILIIKSRRLLRRKRRLLLLLLLRNIYAYRLLRHIPLLVRIFPRSYVPRIQQFVQNLARFQNIIVRKVQLIHFTIIILLLSIILLHHQ